MSSGAFDVFLIYSPPVGGVIGGVTGGVTDGLEIPSSGPNVFNSPSVFGSALYSLSYSDFSKVNG